jgi:hypothetical protein
MMSLGEKIYLAMVVFMFASFLIVMGTLSWLDARADRIQRRHEAKGAPAVRRNLKALEHAGVHS